MHTPLGSDLTQPASIFNGTSLQCANGSFVHAISTIKTVQTFLSVDRRFSILSGSAQNQLIAEALAYHLTSEWNQQRY